MATIIDGKKVALELLTDLKRKVEQLNNRIEQLKEQNCQLEKTIMFLKMMQYLKQPFTTLKPY